MHPRDRLRLPPRLLIATLTVGSGAVAACGASGPPPDAGDAIALDALDDAPESAPPPADAPMCHQPPVPGRVCETTCYVLTMPNPPPTPCEAWCDAPDGGTTSTQCYTYDGQPMLGCTRTVEDGGARVVC